MPPFPRAGLICYRGRRPRSLVQPSLLAIPEVLALPSAEPPPLFPPPLLGALSLAGAGLQGLGDCLQEVPSGQCKRSLSLLLKSNVQAQICQPLAESSPGLNPSTLSHWGNWSQDSVL
jgi:hypothetical protein